jgi:hypothetical protein
MHAYLNNAGAVLGVGLQHVVNESYENKRRRASAKGNNEAEVNAIHKTNTHQ